MIPMNRILLPTDFSELSEHALQYGLDLAKTYKAEVHVLHVVSPIRDMPTTRIGPVADHVGGALMLDGLESIAQKRVKQLEELVSKLSHDQPVAPIIVVRTGSPWIEIANYAQEARIDCVVMGTHARGVMRRIFLGSTSKSVLEHIACPVLMVPIAAIEKRRAAAEPFKSVNASEPASSAAGPPN